MSKWSSEAVQVTVILSLFSKLYIIMYRRNVLHGIPIMFPLSIGGGL